MDKKKQVKALEQNVITIIGSMKKELRQIKKLTDDPDAKDSVICEEARHGAKKLLMVRKIHK